MRELIPYIEQESYRLLIESVKEYAILMIDLDGCILTWNKGAEQIKGYNSNEIIGKHFSVFYTTESLANEEPERNLEMTRDLGRFEDEGWRVRKDGTIFWANVIFTALKDEKGELIGYGKVTRDLTKRRLAEEEVNRLNQGLQRKLQRSESEVLDYKHALDASSIVAITDQKGIINYVNDNFCQIAKYSREELIGQDHRIINSGFHSAEFIRDLWVTIANGRIWRGELKNKAKDGTYYWVDTTIVPFLTERGKPYQYLAIRSDITQRKLAEEELYKSKEELEQRVIERTLELTLAYEREKELNELKSRFVSLASHEFRTPLSAILSSSSLIEHYISPEHAEKRHKHIARIKSSVKDLTNILDDFLSLEKLEKGKIEILYTEFDLKELIADAIDEMDGMLQRKKQTVNYVYNGTSKVYLDKKILRNIILNLLSNAIKYSAEHKDIFITADTDNTNISITIKDDGIGIPLEAQKNLFGKFFRANNAVNIQGTGLGLNIVKSYVELLNGHISFTSTENAGTVFTVQFPVKK